MRLTIAVLGSTISVVPLYFLWAALTGDFDIDSLLVVGYFGLVIAGIGVVLIGLPTHFILRSMKKQRSYFYALPGFLIPAALMLLSHSFRADGYPTIFRQSLQMGVFGAVVALVFWRIAVPRSARNKALY